MSDITKLEEYLLHSSGSNWSGLKVSTPHLEDLCNGQFLNIINCPTTNEVFGNVDDRYPEATFSEALESAAVLHADTKCDSLEKQLEFLCIGISSLQAFVQSNWTGPNLTEDTFPVKCFQRQFRDAEDAMRVSASRCLTLDVESCWVMKNQELLLLAEVILRTCAEKFTSLPSCNWWLMRCLFAHQQMLDDPSPMLHGSLLDAIEKLSLCETLLEDARTALQFHVEAARVLIHYGRVNASNEHVQAALKVAHMNVELVGALGKRTRHQQKEVAQLCLRVTVPPDSRLDHPPPPPPSTDLPRDISLDDDVRLDKVKYSSDVDGEFPSLQPIYQAILLGMFVHTQKSQPKDKLADEELMPFLTCLLSQPMTWSIHVASLLMRSGLESNHRRTVERSLLQVQALVGAVSSVDQTSPAERLSYVHCSYLPHRWAVESQLAGLFVATGQFGSALDIYLRLELWEEVILCYNLLKLRHKAADIIKQELEKNSTVKLWCLLGDATDDPGCYEKAWELSAHKSGRAQRHWGIYFFNKKQYAESLTHFKLSVGINSLQESVWFMLGFAAMEQQDWATCAAAYRRYCDIDSESFEAWNNLAKAYIKLGEKARAYKTLQEALKLNYECWQVWDNFLAVSTDCGEFEDVIRAYHRLLDLKGKHVDEEVLKILVHAIIAGVADDGGSTATRFRKSALALFGRLTGKVTTNATLWQLYAQLTASLEAQTPETLERTAQYLQRAHRAAVQNVRWDQEVATTCDVMRLCISLADAYLACCKKCSSEQAKKLLSSAKFSVQGVVTRVKKEHFSVTIDGGNAELATQLAELETKLDEILETVDNLKDAPPAEIAAS